MRTAKKVQQRKPAPPMRKNRPEQKNTKKTETASKTGVDWRREAFYGVWEGSHRLGHPSKKAQKRGGIPPIPPLLGWVERARDLGKRCVYRDPGKARCIFTAKGRFLIRLIGRLVVHVWFLFLFLRHRKANPHGVPLENQRQRSSMLLFCPPRSRHCSRYVGESCSPLPSTPRAHLAARALPCIWLLCRVFVLVQSQPTNVHTFLKTRERGGPHRVLDHAECYHQSGWVCDCHYYGVGRAASPDSD